MVFQQRNHSYKTVTSGKGTPPDGTPGSGFAVPAEKTVIMLHMKLRHTCALRTA